MTFAGDWRHFWQDRQPPCSRSPPFAAARSWNAADLRMIHELEKTLSGTGAARVSACVPKGTSGRLSTVTGAVAQACWRGRYHCRTNPAQHLRPLNFQRGRHHFGGTRGSAGYGLAVYHEAETADRASRRATEASPSAVRSPRSSCGRCGRTRPRSPDPPAPSARW